MSFTKDGLYYIQSSSISDCYASIRNGEDVLRGDPISALPVEYSRKWRLTQVNQSDASGRSQFFCSLTQEKDNDTLGVKAVKDYQPIYSIDGSQSWFLDQADEGYTIGMNGPDGRYTYNWHLQDKGEPIVINIQGIVPPQSWKFVSAE